jgi:hypothetical protein
MGWLAARTDRGRFECRKEPYEMRMQNEHPAVELDIKHPRVLIDQTESFATSGLKTCHRQMMDYYKECERKGTAVAGTIAEEGEEFLRIERNNKPIQDQARRLWAKDPHLTVVSMPRVPPTVTLDRGTVEVTLKEGDPNTQFVPVVEPGIYEAAEVHGSWLQEPYIVIDAVPQRIPGRIVDTLV